jgi:hypothetical protein
VIRIILALEIDCRQVGQMLYPYCGSSLVQPDLIIQASVGKDRIPFRSSVGTNSNFLQLIVKYSHLSYGLCSGINIAGWM